MNCPHSNSPFVPADERVKESPHPLIPAQREPSPFAKCLRRPSLMHLPKKTGSRFRGTSGLGVLADIPQFLHTLESEDPVISQNERDFHLRGMNGAAIPSEACELASGNPLRFVSKPGSPRPRDERVNAGIGRMEVSRRSRRDFGVARAGGRRRSAPSVRCRRRADPGRGVLCRQANQVRHRQRRRRRL